MAEKEMEAAQRAVRKAVDDYDSVSDDEEFGGGTGTVMNDNSNNNHDDARNDGLLPASSPLMRHRGGNTSNTSTVTTHQDPLMNHHHRNNTPSPPPTVQTVSSFDPYDPSSSSAATSSNHQAHDYLELNHHHHLARPPIMTPSLLDDGSVEMASLGEGNKPNTTSHLNVPGGAGYLEMEQEPPRHVHIPPLEEDHAIRTSSGLLLTHRKNTTTNSSTYHHNNNNHMPLKQQRPEQAQFSGGSIGGIFRNLQQDFFEGTSQNNNHNTFGWGGIGSNKKPWDNFFFQPYPTTPSGQHSMVTVQTRRFLSYVKIWVVLSALVLIAMTGVLFHSVVRHRETTTSSTTSDNTNTMMYQQQLPDQIILLPMENISELAQQKRQEQNGQQQQAMEMPHRQLTSTHYGGGGGGQDHKKHNNNNKNNHGHDNKNHNNNNNHNNHGHDKNHNNNHNANSIFHHHQEDHHHHHGIRQGIEELRQEFENWVKEHGKTYHSHHEKERRFHIWSDNHHKTVEKNRRHGPCKLTKQQVFGSNHLKDLTTEEFKSQYLTGYTGPKTDELERRMKQMPLSSRSNTRNNHKHRGQVLNPKTHKPKIHHALKQRMLFENQPVMTTRNANCLWYDVSCWLRWIWEAAGIQFGSIVGTMEPKYDANTYPNAIDWRDYGAVTSVRAQGACGACWAITAVETVESAVFIGTGQLYDLSETEVIVCEEDCEMCSGGWPQNAFEWVMKQGGLPLYNSFPYDASYLYSLTASLEGGEDTVKSYRQQVCPADGNSGSGSGSGSQDEQDNDQGDDQSSAMASYQYADTTRYGQIKGYGYATDRCVCYSDNSGCDCDSQDEDLAVANVASYGPAVVCLEASRWQDYTGGILTSDIGCTSAFMDMNHCVQVVGYAFGSPDNSEEEEEEHNSQDGNSRDDRQLSGSNDNKNSGSQDDSSEREGYWIVRNQWGTYWGMNGYAYVAMGENTCGILNDMTQAYLDGE